MAISGNNFQSNFTSINQSLISITHSEDKHLHMNNIERKCDEIARNKMGIDINTVMIDYPLAKRLKKEGKINQKIFKTIRKVHIIQLKNIINTLKNSSAEECQDRTRSIFANTLTNIKQSKTYAEKFVSKSKIITNNNQLTFILDVIKNSNSLIVTQIKSKCALAQPLVGGLSIEQNEINKLREERTSRLIHVMVCLTKGLAILPTDRVQRKCFPNTDALYLGSLNKPETIKIETRMQEIAQELGLILITDSRNIPSNSNTLIINPLAESEKALAAFSQDFMEFSNNFIYIGYIPVKERTQFEIRDLLQEARPRREDLYKNAECKYMSTRTTLPGTDRYKKTMELAHTLEVPLKMHLTCTEGGNVLFGERNGNPCMIVGYDTVELNRTFLKEDLSKFAEEGVFSSEIDFTEDDIIKNFFGFDFGVDPKNVIFVEQPGEYHLDMVMSFLSDNTILLNDTGQTPESIEGDELRKTVILLEKKVKGQLEDEGFKVIFAPCVSIDEDDPYRPYTLNLCNTVSGVSNNTGDKFIIALGCPKESQNEFKNILHQAKVKIKEDKIYFLDYPASLACLVEQGGISCLTKSI